MADAHDRLTTYLNDHVSGATSAIELMSHLATAYAGEEVATFAEALRADVLEDRETLDRIAADLGVARSPARAAVAWVGEKVLRLKLRLDDPALRGLHLLESLEALSLGIEGKRLLWISLDAAGIRGATGRPDYEALIRRAESQRAEVERRRRIAAAAALI